MAKHPWLKFYPTAWRADPGLRMCSAAARGLWIELLCLMHEADPRGHLIVRGNVPTDAQLAVLAGLPVDQLSDLIAELENAGVFSRTRTGVIYSRRMTRDERAAQEGRKHGVRGGTPPLCNQRVSEGGLTPPDKPGDKPTHIPKRLEVRDISDEISPPRPPPVRRASPEGSRLSPDWSLPDDWRQWAIANYPGVDPDDEADTFRNHWHAEVGPKARKADWNKTWRNWIKRAAGYGRNRAGTPNRGPLSDDERRKLLAGGYAQSVARERAVAGWDDGGSVL